MKRMFYISLLFLFILTSCIGDTEYGTDSGQDTGTYHDAIVVVQDLPMLEKLPYDTSMSFDMGYSDVSEHPDSSDMYRQDLNEALLMDTGGSDMGMLSDVTTRDSGPETGCDTCPAGYSCISGDCVYIAQCDETGITDIDQINPLMNGYLVKLKGAITIGNPSCSLQVCTKTNPCCKSCFASLKLGPITLKGDGLSIGCMGTNCDYTQKCAPFKPQELNYIVWGKMVFSGLDMELLVQGYCKDE